MDHYQVLGLPRNCNIDALRKAFRELSKTQHPDRFPDAQREAAEKRYQQICVAFNVLKNQKQRAQYDKVLSRGRSGTFQRSNANEDPAAKARKYYRTGQSLMQSGQYEKAVECFKHAVHYQSDAEFYYQKGIAESKIQRLRKDALNSLQRAIEMKPREPKYHLQLIRAMIEFGLSARAKVFLERSIGQFPNNEELLELGRQLDPAKYKKGILGSLFGKKR